MGCDIHAYKEKMVGGEWVTADEWEPYDDGDEEKGQDVPWKKRFTGRNYNLFGLLAGVRNREGTTQLAPRGMPWDVSPEVKMANERWDSDGHSHSYLYLHELRSLRAWTDKRNLPVSGMKKRSEVESLQASIESGSPDWGLLYPYCQGTNDREQIEFRVEIPMSFMVGKDLDEIIAGFDGIDGENHRLVFWFDN